MLILPLNARDGDEDVARSFQRAAAILHHGGLVAYPTETYYGLACDPRNTDALNRLFTVKERPDEKPISVIIDNVNRLHDLVHGLTEELKRKLLLLWPAPVTVILPAKRDLPEILTARTGRIAIRLPESVSARRLASTFGFAVTATSANRSGMAPASTTAQIGEQLGTRIDAVLDMGSCPGGSPTTMIDFQAGEVRILREGVWTEEVIVQRLNPANP